MLREEFPATKVIRNESNLGFAKATNQGLVQSQARYKLLLNNDTIVHAGALQGLVASMDAHPDLAGLGPRLLNRDGTVQPSCMNYPSILKAPINNLRARIGVSNKFAPEESRQMVRVPAVTGACLLLRSAAIQAVGLLDEGYFMYAEEMDWCYRATKQGWAIGYLPAVEVTHFGGQTASRQQDRFYVERRFSGVRFHRKHHGRLQSMVAAFFVRANLCLSMLTHPRQHRRYAGLLGSFNDRMQALARERW